MITLLVLSIIFIALIVIAVSTLAVGGTAFMLIFGDIIACIFVLGILIKWLRNKKK